MWSVDTVFFLAKGQEGEAKKATVILSKFAIVWQPVASNGLEWGQCFVELHCQSGFLINIV